MPSTRLISALILSGFYAIIAQILIIHEFLISFSGNELSIGLFFIISVPISKLCERRSESSFLSNIPRPIDGAVITSLNERDLDCVVTFQTESILERFMIRFEVLALDCNDKLILYDGAHAIGHYKVLYLYLN